MKKFFIGLLITITSINFIACNNQSKNQNENNQSTSINQNVNNNIQNNSNNTQSKITIEQAKEIALKHANLSENQVNFIKTDQEIDHGIQKYNIELYFDNKEYDYNINANTGDIISFDCDMGNYNNNNQSVNNNQNKITVEQAKEIALKHANLSENQVKFIKTDQEIDHGIEKYNIEFYFDNKEYDYNINANTGDIISFDCDMGNYNNNNQSVNNNQNKITVEQAKQIALKHANLSENQVNFIKVNKDIDDGVEKYDIKFYFNNKEYEYDINANTGDIISFDYD